jgi:16S rRNA (cytosine1402-N4)-methyltransferase
MLSEVLNLLNIVEGAVIVDGTVGHGGHAEAMLRAAGEGGELIAFDWDLEMLKIAEQNLKDTEGRKAFVCADYREIPSWLNEHRPEGIDAALLDFGVNLQHLEDAARGFSFGSDAQLDMRMDRSTKETAAAWLNRATEGQIARALREFGGERWAGPIAKQIVKRRKDGGMHTTYDLVDAVLRAIPAAKRDKRIHPATRTFQAVRIQVNQELEDLEEAVVGIGRCLRNGGTMATISYHSGEDAAAKNAFKRLAAEGCDLISKKPIRPCADEVRDNPNSRSARLRALVKGAKQ